MTDRILDDLNVQAISEEQKLVGLQKQLTEAKAAYRDAQASGTKEQIKNTKLAMDRLKDELDLQDTKLDDIRLDITKRQSAAKAQARQLNSERNVVTALDELNAYYISTKGEWYCIYDNGRRQEPIVEAYANERMRDIVFGRTGWVETNEQNLKAIARENKRMFQNIERSFNAPNPNVLNQMNELRKFWLKPIYGEEHHKGFDILLLNICGGREDYKEQLEKLIAYRYVKPEDIFIPNIDSCSKGGAGRDTLFHILEIIFTQECCGEANKETFSGTHNGELWGKVWIKISERNTKSIDYNEFKNLTGAHNFRLRRMGENACKAQRTFTFMIFNNGYHSTIPVTGNGSSSEDRRVEPVFSNTSLIESIAKNYEFDEEGDKQALGETIQSLQDNVWQNEEEIAKWLGNIIEKHKPEQMTKLLPLHGAYYQQKIERQKNDFNYFMEQVRALTIDNTCYVIDDMHKIFKISTGSLISKASFGKKMCEWLIGKDKTEWGVAIKDIWLNDLDTDSADRRRKNVVCQDSQQGKGANNPSKLVFNIFEYIDEDKTDDKGKELGDRPHFNNIKGELL